MTINGHSVGTATLTIRASGSTASASVVVTVGNYTPTISANFWSSDNVSTTLNKTHNWGTLQVSVTNYDTANATVTVTRSNACTALQSGSYTSQPSEHSYTVTLSPAADDPTTGIATLSIIPQANGDATYSASYAPASGAAISATSPTIHVTGMSTPAPAVTLSFLSSDNVSTTLNKTYDRGTLQVFVTNFDPANPTVTLTRSNACTFVEAGGFTAHPSANVYTVQLTPSASDPSTGVATLFIIPQSSGDTAYTASYSSVSGAAAVSATSATIHVTGYPKLPQTGVNYTLAYVLIGLSLAAAAAAVTLHVQLKKKQET